MALHLMRELDALKKQALHLSTLVEQNQQKAVRALHTRDARLAEEVIRSDEEINQAEVEVEEECLKILALHQPVAVDLRFTVSVLKITNDLERVGDLAVNIAERAILLSKVVAPDIPLDFLGMASKTEKMLRDSLDALVNFDAELARNVRIADDEVDTMNRDMYEQIKVALRKEPNHVAALVHFLSAARHLERIADLATNIAEDVLYLIEGDIVRHQSENLLE